MKKTYHRNWMSTSGILMTLLVILGAFGAHGLEGKISADELDTYLTGQRYGLIHALGLLIINHIAAQQQLGIRWVNRFLGLGLVLFSAALMLHACRELIGLDSSFFAMLAPLGGLSYVTAWILFTLALRRQ